MKKLKIYCLLALAWLIVGSCKEGGIFNRKCKNVSRLDYGRFEFLPCKDVGCKVYETDYLTTNPQLNYNNVGIYDENWEYTTINGNQWQGKVGSYLLLPSSFVLDYMSIREPFGIDTTKIFYVKYDKDIDTIRLEYKKKNECMYMSYFRAYYNDELVLSEMTERQDPLYNAVVIKK